MIKLEFILAVAAFALALMFPKFGGRIFQHVERALGRLARKKRLSVVVAGSVCVVIRLALIPALGIPQPGMHDEFSNLLAADTFSKGRLTNPTHSQWMHFESFHINHQPTYMSMYPPGNGLIMALGQRITGNPWFGVLLATGLFCGGVTWALQGWLPPTWAFLGGMIAVLRIGLFSYWTHGYWGGSLAAFGGALLIGAYPRLKKEPSSGVATALAMGVLILANTRPYEGGVVCLALAVPYLWLFVRQPSELRPRFFKAVALPLAVVFVSAGVWMLYYNWRVFGDPFTPPYASNRAQYAVVSPLIWQPERDPPAYHHRVMQDFYTNWELDVHRAARAPGGQLVLTVTRAQMFWLFLVGPLLTFPILLTAAHLVSLRGFPVVWLAIASNLVAVALSAFTSLHYWAPAATAVLTVETALLRLLRSFRLRTRRFGRAWVRLLVTAALLVVATRTVGLYNRTSVGPEQANHRQLLSGRAQLIAGLKAVGGRHLIVVRYSDTHSAHAEWVYNDADIDASPVVWAREMNPEADARLLQYFNERQVWLLEPDLLPLRLKPYPPPPASGSGRP
jgi:hypothetical protein